MPLTITEAHPPIPLLELLALIDAFPAMSFDDKKAALTRLVQAHVTISMEWGPGWTYRRARKLDPDIRPDKVDELIWRKGAPARLGRANPPGFQLLYVSDRMNTSLREARVILDPVIVAEFGIRAGRSTRVAPVGEFAQVGRTGRGYLSGNASEAVTGMMNACSPVDGLSLVITDAFCKSVSSPTTATNFPHTSHWRFLKKIPPLQSSLTRADGSRAA